MELPGSSAKTSRVCIKHRNKNKSRRKALRNMLGSDIVQLNNANKKREGTDTDRDEKQFIKSKRSFKSHKTNKYGNIDVKEIRTFQTQALEIDEPGPEFDPSARPQNGKEFLMRMHYERERCPAIMQCRAVGKPRSTTDIDSISIISMDKQNKLREHSANTKFTITHEWINAQTCVFLKSSSKITLIRMSANKSTAELNDTSIIVPPDIASNEAEWQKFCRENEPKLSVILLLNHRQLEILLEYLSKWLWSTNTAQNSDDMSDCEQEKSAESDAALIMCDLRNNERWLGSWVYATLACLQLPLEPYVHNTLREIARSCIQLRSQWEQDNEMQTSPYNLFLVLIVYVFRQFDFEEFLKIRHNNCSG